MQAPKLLLAGGLIRSLVQHIEPKVRECERGRSGRCLRGIVAQASAHPLWCSQGARSSTRDLAMEILLDASVRHRETRGWLARVPSLVKWLCDCKHRCTVPPKDAVGSVARKPGADAAFDVQAALWLVAFSLPGVTVTGATVDLSVGTTTERRNRMAWPFNGSLTTLAVMAGERRVHLPPGTREAAAPSSPPGCRRTARGASAAIADFILLAQAVVVAGVYGGECSGADGLGGSESSGHRK